MTTSDMQIIPITKHNKNLIDNLVLKHIGRINYHDGYIYVDNKENLFGYTILNKININNVAIEWIYAKKGYGTSFMKKLEIILKETYKKILLKVSIDPTEQDKKCY